MKLTANAKRKILIILQDLDFLLYNKLLVN